MFHLTIHAKLLYYKNFNTHIHDRKIPVISLCFKMWLPLSSHWFLHILKIQLSSYLTALQKVYYTHTKKTQQKKNPARLFTLLCFAIPPCLIFFFKLKKTNPHSQVSVRLVINYHYPVITLSAVFLHNKLNKPLINKSKKKKRRREAGEWTELMVIRHSKIYISHCIYKHYQNLTKHFNRVKLNHWYQGDLEEEKLLHNAAMWQCLYRSQHLMCRVLRM